MTQPNGSANGSMNDAEQLQITIDDARQMVARGVRFERLRNDPVFHEIITEGYLRTEAIRLVHLKGDPGMQAEATQKAIDADIRAISSFTAYLDTLVRQSQLMASSLDTYEQELEAAEEEVESERDPGGSPYANVGGNVSAIVPGNHRS